jgi:hypothetical protein
LTCLLDIALATPGIPVTPIAAVPRDSATTAEQPGYITLPPDDIAIIDVYNPATLTQNALWYAVNPSYDWLYALGRCLVASFHSPIVPHAIPLFHQILPLRGGRRQCPDRLCQLLRGHPPLARALQGRRMLH